MSSTLVCRGNMARLADSILLDGSDSFSRTVLANSAGTQRVGVESESFARFMGFKL